MNVFRMQVLHEVVNVKIAIMFMKLLREDDSEDDVEVMIVKIMLR